MAALRRSSFQTAEDFAWVAHLDDGAAWPERGPDGRSRGWASIPEERRVVAIELIAQRPTHHDVRVEVPDGANAIFFRRRRLNIRLSDGAERDHQTITVAGWTTDDDARYLAIWPTGNNRTVRSKGEIQ